MAIFRKKLRNRNLCPKIPIPQNSFTTLLQYELYAFDFAEFFGEQIHYFPVGDGHSYMKTFVPLTAGGVADGKAFAVLEFFQYFIEVFQSVGAGGIHHCPVAPLHGEDYLRLAGLDILIFELDHWAYSSFQ